MRLVILGATGFIGKSLSHHFTKQDGFQVLTPTRQQLDLLNRDMCQKYFANNRPDCIINCAVTVHSVEETLRSYFNVVSCYENFGRMIYFGSGSEYNPSRYIPLMKEHYSTNSFPEAGYPFAKWIIGNEIERNALKNVINLRLFAVYGAYENFKQRFISSNICKVLSGGQISLNQDVKFDFIYIDDLCEVVHKVLEAKTTCFQTYNVCSGRPVKLSTLASLIKEIMEVETPINIITPGERPEYSGSPERAIEEFGSFPFTSYENSILTMINHFKGEFKNNNLFKNQVLGIFND